MGFSPLLQASQDGHLGMVKLLAEHGAGMDMNSATNVITSRGSVKFSLLILAEWLDSCDVGH